MKKAITVSVPEELQDDLDKYAQAEGLSRSEVVKESLKEYLFVRKFRKLRKKMMPKAQAEGVYTDEDVFKEIS